MNFNDIFPLMKKGELIRRAIWKETGFCLRYHKGILYSGRHDSDKDWLVQIPDADDWEIAETFASHIDKVTFFQISFDEPVIKRRRKPLTPEQEEIRIAKIAARRKIALQKKEEELEFNRRYDKEQAKIRRAKQTLRLHKHTINLIAWLQWAEPQPRHEIYGWLRRKHIGVLRDDAERIVQKLLDEKLIVTAHPWLEEPDHLFTLKERADLFLMKHQKSKEGTA